jgi:hypothetical protein
MKTSRKVSFTTADHITKTDLQPVTNDAKNTELGLSSRNLLF